VIERAQPDYIHMSFYASDATVNDPQQFTYSPPDLTNHPHFLREPIFHPLQNTKNESSMLRMCQDILHPFMNTSDFFRISIPDLESMRPVYQAPPSASPASNIQLGLCDVVKVGQVSRSFIVCIGQGSRDGWEIMMNGVDSGI
jgi:hypothetical protein